MLHSFKRWRPFAAERGKSFGCICAGRNRIDLAAREAGHFGRPFWKGPVNKAFEQLNDQRRVGGDLVGVIEGYPGAVRRPRLVRRRAGSEG